MLRLHVVQAEQGDALVLEYGTPVAPRLLLIDGGPAQVYGRHLRGVLAGFRERVPELDLAVLSHVDNDHVIGLLDYFAELQTAPNDLPRPRALWHNAFSEAIDPTGAIAPRLASLQGVARAAMPMASAAVNGIGEGRSLRMRALAANIPINPDVPGGLVAVDTLDQPIQFGNLTLRIVGPTRANLEALRTKWIDWLDAHEADIEGGEVSVLANSDRSLPNLSSIMMLATAEGRTILLTGDGRSDHLLEGLGTTGLLDDDGNFHVDVLKLPHHGSDRNMTRGFIRRVTADTYVASANGRDGNPDLAALIWIVEAARAQERQIELVVTNATPSTEKLLAEYPPNEYRYSLTVLPPTAHAQVIDLAP